ncbi:MAG: pantoate--beta-alanine ligase [Paenibacillaceae bacterium]
MRVYHKITELQAEIHSFRTRVGRDQKVTIGFVPTMGYLHAGHESLLQHARSHDDLVVLSIFVNPLQFGPNEDFETYPRNTEQDLQLAEQAGVDIVFLPSVEEMYPQYPLATKVTIGDIASGLCGASRPGHFDGVVTVVSKLFHIVIPDHAYFGQKDIQQVAVITQMVQDLNMSVKIIPCPTVRVTDGLALSSRNVYLKPDERSQAIILSQTLAKADEWLSMPNITAEQLEEQLALEIKKAPLANIEYATLVSYPDLQPFEVGVPIAQTEQWNGHKDVVIVLAVKFGKTRLIDNRIMKLSGGVSHA